MRNITKILPAEATALLSLVVAKKGQSSLEYIMMISAASIVIVLALAMIVKLKGVAVQSISANGMNVSVSQAIANELGSLASNAV